MLEPVVETIAADTAATVAKVDIDANQRRLASNTASVASRRSSLRRRCARRATRRDAGRGATAHRSREPRLNGRSWLERSLPAGTVAPRPPYFDRTKTPSADGEYDCPSMDEGDNITRRRALLAGGGTPPVRWRRRVRPPRAPDRTSRRTCRRTSTRARETTGFGVELAGRPIAGEPDAPVDVYYWTDYLCPFCKGVRDGDAPRHRDGLRRAR